MLRLPRDLDLPADLLERAQTLGIQPGRPTIAYARESDAGERHGKATDVFGQLRRQFDRLYLTDARLIGLYVETRSAFKAAGRPEFAELLALVAGGQVEVITASRADRVARNRGDGHEFVTVCEKRGVLLRTTTDGDFDLGDLRGQEEFEHAILGARRESRIKRDRARDRRGEQAEQGIHFGGPRTFGWAAAADETGRVPTVPGEFEHIAPAIADLLAGDTPYAITQRWNAAGIRTARGREWQAEHWVKFVTRPRIAGLRDTGDGVLVAGPFDAAVDRATWEAVCVRFTSPDPAHHEPAQRYTASLLGVGIYRCGQCLERHAKDPAYELGRIGSGGKGYYRCRKCYAHRRAEPIDALVMEQVNAYLHMHDETPPLPPFEQTDFHQQRLFSIRRKQQDAAAQYAADELTAEEYETLRSALRIEERRARDAQDAFANEYMARVEAAVGEAQFEGWPMARQRKWIDRQFVITLKRVDPKDRSRGFDPATVEVKPRS